MAAVRTRELQLTIVQCGGYSLPQSERARDGGQREGWGNDEDDEGYRGAVTRCDNEDDNEGELITMMMTMMTKMRMPREGSGNG